MTHSVIIFTDEAAQNGGWHGAELALALAKLNAETQFVNLQNCGLSIEDNQPTLNGFAMPKMPHFFVRGIAGGSLQQITQRLNILHWLNQQGARVMNNGRAIERTVDKAMTSFLLVNQGLSTPNTWVFESRQQAHTCIQVQRDLGKQSLLKPLFGSQGQGIRLLKEDSTWPLPFDAHVDGVFYLQQFIQATHDYRVLVIQNEPIAAMRRQGEGWLHNVAQGARCVAIDDLDVLTMASEAAKALQIDYCGVDLLRDAQGKLWVIEVNGIPAWRGLQSVTNFNIAEKLAAALFGPSLVN